MKPLEQKAELTVREQNRRYFARMFDGGNILQPQPTHLDNLNYISLLVGLATKTELPSYYSEITAMGFFRNEQCAEVFRRLAGLSEGQGARECKYYFNQIPEGNLKSAINYLVDLAERTDPEFIIRPK